MTVTRTELDNHIQAACAAGPATRDSMLAYAAGSHARPAVIAVIQALPDKTYPSNAPPVARPVRRPRRRLDRPPGGSRGKPGQRDRTERWSMP